MTPGEFERWFHRLRAFLSAPRTGSARIAAIAHFVLSLPLGRRGFLPGTYLEDLHGPFRETFSTWNRENADPELVALALRTRSIFIHEGLEFPEPSHAAAEAEARRDSNTPTIALPGRGGALVRFPVIYEIPSGDDNVPGAAEASALSVRPSVATLGEDEIELNATGQHLHPVATRAREIAEATLFALHPARGKRLPKREPQRILFQCVLKSEAPTVEGRSIELAFGLTMLGTYEARRRGGRGFKPSPKLAWTGCLDDTGAVTEVTGSSLRLKVRAAWFHQLDGIVVPETQVHIAEDAAQELRAESHARRALGGLGVRTRPLAVYGATSLEELSRRRELLEPWRIDFATRRVPTWLWATATLVLTALALSGVGLLQLRAMNAPGPRVERAPTPHHAVTVYLGGVQPPISQHEDASIEDATVARRISGCSDDGLRLVLGRQFREGRNSALLVYKVPPRWLWFLPNRLEWEWQFTSAGLPDEPLHSHPDAFYNPRNLLVGDIDADGRNEIIVGATLHPHSTCVVQLFDEGREPEGAVLIRGHLSSDAGVVADVDNDGVPECVLPGLHQASHGASVLFLRKSDFFPCSQKDAKEAIATWDPARQPCLAHFVFPPLKGMEAISTGEWVTGSPRVIQRPGQSSVVQVELYLRTPEGAQVAAMFVNITVPPAVVNAYPNDVFRTKVAEWRGEGRLTQDILSEENLHAWTTSFRYANHIILESAETESPLLEEAAR